MATTETILTSQNNDAKYSEQMESESNNSDLATNGSIRYENSSEMNGSSLTLAIRPNNSPNGPSSSTQAAKFPSTPTAILSSNLKPVLNLSSASLTNQITLDNSLNTSTQLVGLAMSNENTETDSTSTNSTSNTAQISSPARAPSTSSASAPNQASTVPIAVASASVTAANTSLEAVVDEEDEEEDDVQVTVSLTQKTRMVRTPNVNVLRPGGAALLAAVQQRQRTSGPSSATTGPAPGAGASVSNSTEAATAEKKTAATAPSTGQSSQPGRPGIGTLKPTGSSQRALPASKSATKTAGVDLDNPGDIGGYSTLEYPIETLEEKDKPWNRPGADITDYFNFGFNEQSWRTYVAKQRDIRNNSTRPGGSQIGLLSRKPLPQRPGQTHPSQANTFQNQRPGASNTGDMANSAQSQVGNAIAVQAPSAGQLNRPLPTQAGQLFAAPQPMNSMSLQSLGHMQPSMYTTPQSLAAHSQIQVHVPNVNPIGLNAAQLATGQPLFASGLEAQTMVMPGSGIGINTVNVGSGLVGVSNLGLGQYIQTGGTQLASVQIAAPASNLITNTALPPPGLAGGQPSIMLGGVQSAILSSHYGGSHFDTNLPPPMFRSGGVADTSSVLYPRPQSPTETAAQAIFSGGGSSIPTWIGGAQRTQETRSRSRSPT